MRIFWPKKSANFFFHFRQKLSILVCRLCYVELKYEQKSPIFKKMCSIQTRKNFLILALIVIDVRIFNWESSDIAKALYCWNLIENPPNHDWDKKSTKVIFTLIKTFRKQKMCKMYSWFQFRKNYCSILKIAQKMANKLNNGHIWVLFAYFL